ncbi:MAG: AMP-binding protein [Sterolibacterium sp.]|nr:AMP-binding protein [Sterolibacterium sp.]
MHPPYAFVDSFVRDHLPPAANWPLLRLDQPGLSYPPLLNCAVELLDRKVDEGYGEHIALRTLEAVCTYRQLLHRANGIARVLRDRFGLVPGQRVLLRGYNHPLLAACWLGVLKAGGVVVTSMPLLRAAELTQMISKARVGFALCDVRLRDELELARSTAHDLHTICYFNESGPDALEAWLDDLSPAQTASFANICTRADEAALIAFTSGTTGQPKASVHFHRDVLAICDAFPRAILEPQAGDIYCGTSPLAFTYGLGGLLCFPLRHGASSLLLEKPTADDLLRAIAQHRVSLCFSVPTFWRQMAAKAHDYDLSSLRCCVSAGEPLPEATRALWRLASGLDIIDGLGTTELLHIFISHPPGEGRAGAVGRVIPGYEACIMDAQGKPLPAGQTGRLAVRGPTGCRYLDDERQQAYVIDGWNLTGDTGMMDADGYFYYAARSDDIIVSSGYNIAGPEVEGVLLQHPDVQDCAVVGVPDSERGQIVKAWVVTRCGVFADAALAAELQRFVKQRIAPYKYPRLVVFVDSLPRTETSKLQRYRLRQESM